MVGRGADFFDQKRRRIFISGHDFPKTWPAYPVNFDRFLIGYWIIEVCLCQTSFVNAGLREIFGLRMCQNQSMFVISTGY